MIDHSSGGRATPPRLNLSLAPEPSRLLRSRERIRDYVALHCVDQTLVNDVVLAIQEACTNAIRHSGVKDDIEISIGFEGRDLRATVKDKCRGFDVAVFDPDALPDPLLDHGRGLFLMSRLCDQMDLRCDSGLEVRLVKRAVLQAAPPSGGHDHALVTASHVMANQADRLRIMLEEIDEAFFALDWEYRYVHANVAGLHTAGKKTLDELLGRTPWELFPQLRGSPLEDRYRQAMELGRPSVTEHRSVYSGDWLEVRIYPTPAGASAYYREINERKRAEEELRLHNDELLERAHLADSLNAINRLLHATVDFDTIMQSALDEGASALGADVGIIEVREGSHWVVRYTRGLGGLDSGLRLSAAEAPIASRVERRGEPLAIADVQTDAGAEASFLRAYGLHSLVAVPLLARAAVIGCLIFRCNEVHVFSDAEIDFTRKLGATVSLALENARLYEEQQHIAQTLQENFIHPLPEVAGLELGVIARVANEPELVGGDFSDVFVVDEARVVLLIGDVAGKGVRAAGLTESVRSTVRALAAVDPSPPFILGKTNELLLRLGLDEPHVTAFVAVLDRHTGRVDYASAGHPPPLRLGATTCGALDVTCGPPLGTFARPYANAQVGLTSHEYLVLYTDGVTEARRGRELLGERRLLEIVAGLWGRPAQGVAEGVCDSVLAFAGSLRDDLQIVVLRLGTGTG